MAVTISEARNVQTFIIVWDINLEMTYKMDYLKIFTPLFSFDSNKSSNSDSNYIRLTSNDLNFYIHSNLSTTKELKRCTTYMINPLTDTVLDIYEGFRQFSWNQYFWNQNLRFVFELEMQRDSSAVQPAIWKHFITELLPTNDMSANKDTKTHDLEPASSTDIRHFTILISNNSYENPYVHINLTADSTHLGALRNTKYSQDVQHASFCEIYESIVSDADMTAIASVIKPHLSSSASINETSAAKSSKNEHQLNPIAEKQEMQYRQKFSSNLMEHFDARKFCDITIHIEDQQIRAHKMALSTGSIIWRDLFDKDEQLNTIHFTDFDYETIKELIEFIYTGKVKNVTDQLLIAADKYGVTGLKDLCENTLLKTIEMENVVDRLVLAESYKASALYDKVVDFVGENFKAFMMSESAKDMFLVYPELAFKLFARVSAK